MVEFFDKENVVRFME